MLHTKIRGNLVAGSVEEDFKGFLPYMGVVVNDDVYTKFGLILSICSRY